MTKNNIAIVGSGLVGSLISIMLAKRSISITVFEKRDDIRKSDYNSGKSINLALSTRGWNALKAVGLTEQVEKLSIAMFGRMIHSVGGKSELQPYTLDNKAIYSISRNDLNKLLMEEAERLDVKLNFNSSITNLDIDSCNLTINNNRKYQFDTIFGADGANSMIRKILIENKDIQHTCETLDYGYKEFTLEAKEGDWALAKNALHIWPRKNFMLIALPNLNGSFTCTLFLQLEGEVSFENLKHENNLRTFFNSQFGDVSILIPDLEDQFLNHAVCHLRTEKCFPWSYDKNLCLIGDAAHAIVPFYGQGMNCGFEDCMMLNGLISKYGIDWGIIFKEFESSRKPNTDAISKMAMDNFIEMRDLVTDPDFLLKRKLEAEMKIKYPESWQTLYEMVTFSTIPYLEAYEQGQRNDEVLKEMMIKKNGID